VTGAAFLLLCVRAASPSAGRTAARDVFAFTMAHLAIVLVAIGIR
jgi:heme O synthase-like polyprenyltransferase